MDAWTSLVTGFLSRHPLLAPLLVFWWQAASHDVMSFVTTPADQLNPKSWNYRRMFITWGQGIVAGFIGMPVLAGVASATGAVVGLVWWALR